MRSSKEIKVVVHKTLGEETLVLSPEEFKWLAIANETLSMLSSSGCEAVVKGGAVLSVLTGSIKPSDIDIMLPELDQMENFPYQQQALKSKFFSIESNGFDLYTWRHSETGFPVDFVFVPVLGFKTQTVGKNQNGICTHDRIFMYFDANDKALHIFSPIPNAIDNFIERKFIHCGDFAQMIQEDPSRIFRIVRDSVRYGLELTKHQKQILLNKVFLINKLDNGKLRQMVSKILLSGHAVQIVELLHQFGALKLLFPDLDWIINRKSKFGEFYNFFIDRLRETDNRIKAGLGGSLFYMLALCSQASLVKNNWTYINNNYLQIGLQWLWTKEDCNKEQTGEKLIYENVFDFNSCRIVNTIVGTQPIYTSKQIQELEKIQTLIGDFKTEFNSQQLNVQNNSLQKVSVSIVPQKKSLLKVDTNKSQQPSTLLFKVNKDKQIVQLVTEVTNCERKFN